jgi:hypothetical protein
MLSLRGRGEFLLFDIIDRRERAPASVGWAKAPTGPREARPDDKLRAEPTRPIRETMLFVGTLRFADYTKGPYSASPSLGAATRISWKRRSIMA